MDQETGPLTDGGWSDLCFLTQLACHHAHPIQSLWSLIVGGNVEALTRRVGNNESPSHKNFQTRNAGITKLVDMQRVASLPALGPVTFAVGCGHHPCTPSLQKWTYNQKKKQLASAAWWGIQATWGTRPHTSTQWSCTDTAEITTGGRIRYSLKSKGKWRKEARKCWMTLTWDRVAEKIGIFLLCLFLLVNYQ